MISRWISADIRRKGINKINDRGWCGANLGFMVDQAREMTMQVDGIEYRRTYRDGSDGKFGIHSELVEVLYMLDKEFSKIAKSSAAWREMTGGLVEETRPDKIDFVFMKSFLRIRGKISLSSEALNIQWMIGKTPRSGGFFVFGIYYNFVLLEGLQLSLALLTFQQYRTATENAKFTYLHHLHLE